MCKITDRRKQSQAVVCTGAVGAVDAQADEVRDAQPDERLGEAAPRHGVGVVADGRALAQIAQRQRRLPGEELVGAPDDDAGLAPHPQTLRRPEPRLRQRVADVLLGQPRAVERRRVDVAHAEGQGGGDGADGLRPAHHPQHAFRVGLLEGAAQHEVAHAEGAARLRPQRDGGLGRGGRGACCRCWGWAAAVGRGLVEAPQPAQRGGGLHRNFVPGQPSLP